MRRVSSAVLAFYVGGTDIKAGLISFGQAAEQDQDTIPRITGLNRFPTPRATESADAVVNFLARLAEQYRKEYSGQVIEAIGVTVPGLVDEERGVGIYSANLGWRDFPFRQRLEATFGEPVAFGHDVGTAGDAEFALGAAKDGRDVMILIIGTGIAAALYTDGHRLRAGGYAGEIGHALIPADGELHLLESRASAGAIARRYQDLVPTFTGGAREVLSAAKAGDSQAHRIWTEAVEALGLAIAQSVATLGRSTVVIGGGLAEAGDELFDPLRRVVDGLLSFQPRPVLRKAVLGPEAGLIGSALRAQRMLQERR
ncbi:ROK family protein [Acaricomes phytoseiuli]|uniref:ROK family protein n=1 Tax=Acaricomes phytoseiuli TaxID=291968 RepID=UPI00037E7E94|nr:ROK family protein [Acaricomes phytoseiuli]